jgi:replicative DNA helicase
VTGNGRVPPHSIEAEESLLGAMLLSKDAIASALERVTAEDFYKANHSHLFTAIRVLYGRGEPVDPVTVADELRRSDLLEPLGGKRAILRIQAGTPAAANAAHYARLVEEHSIRRRLVTVGSEVVELAFDGQDDMDGTLDYAESLVFGVAKRRQTDTCHDSHEGLRDVLEAAEARFENGDGMHGISTGYHDLDGILLGLKPGDLVVVAARPGQGKTSFALGAACHVAVDLRRPVLFFSMEMSYVELFERALVAEARVNGHALKQGRVADSEWVKISQATGRLAEAPLMVDDDPYLSVMDVRTRSRRKRAERGDLGLVVVDYLQLMTVPKRGENRQTEVADISRSLKLLARELEVPVLALAQLNRSLEYRADKRPLLADLRDSGAVEQDADVVCFIYRDELYNPDSSLKGIAEISVAKHRNGPTGKVQLAFLAHQSKFENMARL